MLEKCRNFHLQKCNIKRQDLVWIPTMIGVFLLSNNFTIIRIPSKIKQNINACTFSIRTFYLVQLQLIFNKNCFLIKNLRQMIAHKIINFTFYSLKLKQLNLKYFRFLLKIFEFSKLFCIFSRDFLWILSIIRWMKTKTFHNK